MSYVVVHFPERREVIIDGQSQGNNVDENGSLRVLICHEGPHMFRLGGASDYTPPEQTVDVPDASALNPFPVIFEKKAGPGEETVQGQFAQAIPAGAVPRRKLDATRVLSILIAGDYDQRSELIVELDGTASRLDCSEVRARILEALQRFAPGVSDERATVPRGPQEPVYVRSWLLGALARVMEADFESRKIFMQHLESDVEPAGIVRFWALAGLWRVNPEHSMAVAGSLVARDPDDSVRTLAYAIQGDLGHLRELLNASSFVAMWPALRALRIVGIPDLADSLCESLFRDVESPIAYDVLWAIANPRVLPQAADMLTNRFGLERVFQKVIEASQRSSRTAVRVFATVLAHFPNTPVRGLLQIALHSPDAPTREAAQLLATFLDSPIASAGLSSDAVVPGATDLLGVDRDVRTLCAVLLARDVTPPISVGLFGDWGTGKTFFMQQMYDEVNRLAAKADASSRLHSRVAQIRFNAWHYIDSNLWASLVSYILEELATAAVPRESEEQAQTRLLNELETAKELKAEAQREKGRAEQERQDVEKQLATLAGERAKKEVRLADLRATDLERLLEADPTLRRTLEDAAGHLGVRAAVGSVAELERSIEGAYSLAGRCRAVVMSFRTSPSHGLVIALMIVLLAGFPLLAWGLRRLLDQPLLAQVSALMGEVVVLAGATSALLRKHLGTAGGWLQKLEAARTQVDKALAAKKEQASQEELQLEKELNEIRAKETSATQQLSAAEARVRALETKVREIDDARSLSKFLLERVGADDYRKQLGIISTIRKDFERLSDLLRAPGEGKQIVERIVLYIDDLDRCPASTVVEVLQAVHLLLAYPLFVVVVGVDSRWLLHSLERQYSAFREPGQHAKLWLTTPQNYLEKIFQIPLALRPMGTGGFRRLMETLLPETREATETPRTPAPSTEIRSEARSTDGTTDFPQTQSPGREVEPDREVNPASLDIRLWEFRFAARLHAFVPTPRAAKRFSNVYRLLKAPLGTGELPGFEGTANDLGDFRAPMLLLAILTGFQHLARPLFVQIITTWANETPSDVFGSLKTRASSLDLDVAETERLARCLEPLLKDLPESMKPFAEWAPLVARFSFETAADLGSFYAAISETPTRADVGL